MSVQAPSIQLQIRELSHHYGSKQVLDAIQIELMAGEILALVGPSGCGKSTLLRLIAGLEELQTGEIRLDGEVVAAPYRQRAAEQRQIGMVFQDFALFPHLSLLDNVAFGLGKLPAAQRRTQALAMLARVGLAERAADAPHMLSGGQQQRVALARALAPQPRLLLLDEPFSNLDVRLRHRLRQETQQLLRDMRCASILVTHDPEEAMYMADRIALLRDGRIIQIGSPASLYFAPQSPFATEFFGDVNILHGELRQHTVDTALGRFAAPSLGEGQAVQIMIRPEALQLSSQASADSRTVIVQACHHLGAYSRIDLRVDDAAALSLQAEVPGAPAWPPGTRLQVRCETRGVFIFAV
ncbi:ABC transporter ATP-binding protein [Uliginosibacterium sediminicola]|uniref:ABC transporter ATP-binding protein n=1 Tax=Uliginosibacterium sediminicola TaxID=2024550 RepID=A0ABU9YWE1_9RHOO